MAGKKDEKQVTVAQWSYNILLLIAWISIGVSIFLQVRNNDLTYIVPAVVSFLLTLVPFALGKFLKLHIPNELKAVILAFIYSTIFLGTVLGFYKEFWWWDIALHTVSGVILGLVAFYSAFVLFYKRNLIQFPFMATFLTFCFAVTMGTAWEIYEFIGDQYFGANMQDDGLIGTMGDLIGDSVGALFTSVIGYIYLKVGPLPVLEGIVKQAKTKGK